MSDIQSDIQPARYALFSVLPPFCIYKGNKMKRLLMATSTFRHQRGFFRVAALVGLVGFASAGIAAAQQVKAHRPFQVQRKMAGKRWGVRDYTRRPPVSKSHKAVRYRTAADADGNNYEQAVALKAGQRLRLGVSDPAGSVQPGGTWDTDFGTVNASGIYTAPRFTPPEGMDRIHYLDPQSNDVYINVRILPNPAILNSDRTPYVIFPTATGGAIQVSLNQSTQVVGTPEIPFAPTHKTIVVAPGQVPAPPLQINGTTPLIGEIVYGTKVFILPALFGDGTTSAIYARPLDETPQVVTLAPDVSPPTGPCTPGVKPVHSRRALGLHRKAAK